MNNIQDGGLELVSVHLVRDGKAGYGKITTPGDAVKIMSDIIRDMDREYLCVVNLMNDNMPVNASIVSIGDYSSAEARPVMILRSAVISGASSIIVLHNHTSGTVKPSNADKRVTENLMNACEMMGIRLVDHIIVGDRCHYSFNDDRVIFEDGTERDPGDMYEHITFKRLLEKYFITPQREGYSYNERMKEGYEMLELIADDLDKAGDGSMKIKEYVRNLAKKEGIINKIPVQMRAGSSR